MASLTKMRVPQSQNIEPSHIKPLTLVNRWGDASIIPEHRLAAGDYIPGLEKRTYPRREASLTASQEAELTAFKSSIMSAHAEIVRRASDRTILAEAEAAQAKEALIEAKRETMEAKAVAARAIIEAAEQVAAARAEAGEAAREAEGAVRQLDSQTKCTICMDNNRNVRVDPCGHFSTCQECMDMGLPSGNPPRQRCPICRVPITNTQRTILS